MKIFINLLSITIALGLAACQSPGEPEHTAPSAALEPMAKPEPKVGREWHYLKNGKEHVETILATDGDFISAKTTEGCSWTTKAWEFAPSSEWSNCAPFKDGTQTISAVKGEIWPLEVGKEVSYDLRGSAGGDTWSGTRRCKVQDQARIATASGEHDTYKVVCNDPWTKRTWYVSPELEETVLFVRHRKRQNETTKLEMTRLE